ncbi:putative Co/Zn/Cd efflux system membrane fusion protein [Mucinivorans hirudinis]|uniref:Putative Co/Zn/Cd efflux system membrane fusion protein n=1 Tax=Mucinivorans hirudinis TaxID=1433126 RepID=A0A060RBH8_9BACT|nr:putative Co/Zn/Cd efflux system membrane fusion protein [Mucinivorans hirudinis]
MKNIKGIAGKEKWRALIYVLLGLFAGWIIFGGTSGEQAGGEDVTEQKSEVWTCSMHPQIRSNEKGLCPLCAMDLIPVRSGGGSSEAIADDAIQLSPEATALANIETSRVNLKEPVKNILLYGVIAPDERALQSQTAHIGGRIEKLYVDFTGERVRKGEPLATIYSPELIAAQQELIEALKLQNSQPKLLWAAREKLRAWKLTDEQIRTIESTAHITTTIEIKSNTDGIVMSRRVSEGDYVQQGAVLFDIADLAKVWAMFDAYESDLAFLHAGDKVTFTVNALAGKIFSATISFIDPILDKTTRTAKVRVEIANADMQLKPEMYATARVQARLQQYKNQIVIPQSAVLWTGKRSIVYVLLPEYKGAVYQLREVELGPSLGNAYVVLSGLTQGEEIVTNGVFAIDASAQLEGKRSMMNGREIPSENSVERKIKVEGSCSMCRDRIEKVVKGTAGVYAAKWELAGKELTINFDPEKTSLASISKALVRVGHDTELDRADDNIYDALPACCKYRNKK